MADKTHLDCPDCGHKGCLTEFEESGNTYCHSCGKKTFGEDMKDTTSYSSLPAMPNPEGYRGVPKSIQDFYGVVTKGSKGKPEERVYPYPSGDKYRKLPKTFRCTKGFKSNELFGMDKYNSGSRNTITICEGEEDVLAAKEMLGPTEAVVGLPSSTVSSALLENCKDYLDGFKEIILVPDGDVAGAKILDPFCTLFPNKVSVVNLTSFKDPSDFLQNGKATDFAWAWRNRKKYTPDFIYNSAADFKAILRNKEVNSFVPTPSYDLNSMIKGLMKGHLTVITGQEGLGKTEILRWLEWEMLKNTSTSIGACHLEESKTAHLTTLACYELNKNVRDPDHTVPLADVEKAVIDLVGDRLYLFEVSEDSDPFVLLDKIRYLKTVCGCDYVFLDPIQQLAYDVDGQLSDEQVLSKLSVKLAKLANELDVGIVITAHVNDDGATRSSRMIGKSASVRIDIKRDHMADDLEERNTTRMYVSKNRPVGTTGYAGALLFDKEAFILKTV